MLIYAGPNDDCDSAVGSVGLVGLKGCCPLSMRPPSAVSRR